MTEEFTTPFGLYQSTVMPFGLQGAPATFQCLVDQITHGLEDHAAEHTLMTLLLTVRPGRANFFFLDEVLT
jgi:hypothetical protein